MAAKAAVILQARMNSQRLRGKVLAGLGGRTLLGQCIWRLQASGLPVIVATTTRPDDDRVVQEALLYGAQPFRGAEDDVLQRYVAAAKAFDIAIVIRATADNPAVDCDGPGRLLASIARAEADYVIESGLPMGAACEAVTAQALARAAERTSDAYDREHVTPFVRRASGFKVVSTPAPAHLRRPDLRMTVDTADDLTRMRALLEPFRSAATPPSLSEIITVADLRQLSTSDASDVSQRGA
jgi:spore coat polysaccharide biosynthesis protein SpsF